MRTYDEPQIAATLAQATPAQGAALSWAIGTRLRHNYAVFVERCEWGSLSALDDGLKLLERVVTGELVDRAAATALDAACMEGCPHEDDFEDSTTSQAIYSVAAVAYGLQFLMNGDPQNLAWICLSQFDAVTEYADSVADESESFDNIGSGLSDPRVQRELALQVELLRESMSPGLKSLEALRTILNGMPVPRPDGLIWGAVEAV